MNQLPAVPVPVIRQTPGAAGAGGARINLAEIAAANAMATKLDVRAFSGAAGAYGDIGKGLEGVADGMGRIAADIAASQNRKKVDDADAKLAEASGAIALEIEKERDQSKWSGIFASHSAKWEAELLGDKSLSPVAREAIASRVNQWKIKGTTGTTLAAYHDTIKKEAEGLEGQRIAAIHDGKFAEAYRIIDEQAARGLVGAHTTASQRAQTADEQERRTHKDKAELYDKHQNNVIAAAHAMPAAKVLEMIRMPGFAAGLDDTDKERLANVVQGVGRDLSGEAANSLANGIADGNLNSEAAIRAVQSPHLTPAMRQDAIEALAQFDSRKAGAARAGQAGQDAFIAAYIDARNWKPDMENPEKSGVELAQKLRNVRANVADDLQGEVSMVLHGTFGSTAPKESKVRPEIQRAVTRSLAATYDRMLAPLEKNAEDARAALDKSPGSATAQAAAVAAEDALFAKQQEVFRAAAQTEIKMNDFFKTRPKPQAGDKDVWDHLSKTLPEGTRVIRLEGLYPKAATPAPTGAQGETGDAGSAAPDSPRGYREATALAEKLPPGLREHAADFDEAAAETGLNPYFLAAISMFETGDGTSRAFREKSNAMGISDSKGPTEQPSVRDSIFRQARTLARRNGPYAKATTIEGIGAIYAPPGAGNDPNGTNNEWPAGIRRKLQQLTQ
jgi:hypothetical protein